MKNFFSCDWGTSSFRLRLVNAATGQVLSAIKNDHGIATVYNLWKKTNGDEKDRLFYYQSYLFEQVKHLQSSSGYLPEAPVIVSGMASSSIGMMELPYKKLPFNCDGSDLLIQTVKGSSETATPVMIISGVRSQTDVMRGEETMLAGCDVAMEQAEQLFIFPGTHSKHVSVYNGKAENITTYMTGEMFDLLSNKSILSASVKKNDLEDSDFKKYFFEGVQQGTSLNLLNAIFQVRTNQLFNKTTPEQNYHYLSGLLIGHELKDVAASQPGAVTLICSKVVKDKYREALKILTLTDQFTYVNADEALVKGHCKMYAKVFNT